MVAPRGKPFPVAEIAIVAVALIVLLAAAYVRGRQQQQSASTYDTYSTYDAASGGYEAWFEMLQAEHVRAVRFERRPAFLDGSVDVFVMASDRNGLFARAAFGGTLTDMNDGDWDALARWIRAGGHFVWIADEDTASNYINAPALAQTGPKSGDKALALEPSPLTGVRAVSGTSRLRISFSRGPWAPPIVADHAGSVVTRYALGKGSVTVITDRSLFRNDRIGMADNAKLAFDVATTGLSRRGLIAFDEWSHGFVAGDTWWSLLPQQFRAALIGLAFALALLAAGTAFRFGPVAAPPDASERTSAEYLTSMALLFERGKAAREALRALADAALRDVAASLGLPENARARALADRFASSDKTVLADAIMELDRLRSYEYPHAADLINTARLSAQLRKEIVRHGRIAIGRRRAAARRTA